jgi:2-haloacid dehalogenase
MGAWDAIKALVIHWIKARLGGLFFRLRAPSPRAAPLSAIVAHDMEREAGMDIKGIVFDLYGTLYDVYSVAEASARAFPGHGEAIALLWRRKQLEYTWLRSLMDRYVPFEVATADALRFTCAQLKLPLDEALAGRLCDHYLRLSPYPEMPAALRRLKDAGIPLGIISNGSHHSISQVVNNSGMAWAFDALISVEDVGVFKPHPKVYALCEQRMGGDRGAVLFVSSNPWDASAASLFGFPVCWINRSGGAFDELGATPSVVVDDLAAMADWALTQPAAASRSAPRP